MKVHTVAVLFPLTGGAERKYGEMSNQMTVLPVFGFLLLALRVSRASRTGMFCPFLLGMKNPETGESAQSQPPSTVSRQLNDRRVRISLPGKCAMTPIG